jgi:hypothetical protein
MQRAEDLQPVLLPAAVQHVCPASRHVACTVAAIVGPIASVYVVQVSSTETGAIFGNIVYEGTGAMDRQVTARPTLQQLGFQIWRIAVPISAQPTEPSTSVASSGAQVDASNAHGHGHS